MPACVVICQRYYVIRLALFLFVVGKAPKSTLRSYFNAFDFSMRSVKYFNNLASLALARVLKQTRRRRNQRLGHKKTKLNIGHHMLTSSTQLQNRYRLFQVVERTRTSSKCEKMKNALAKRAKILFFTVKYANL